MKCLEDHKSKKIDQSTFDGILLTYYLVKNKIMDSYSDLNYYAKSLSELSQNFNRLIKYGLSDRRI